MTNTAALILAALLAEKEATSTDADGSVWGTVYLDNARPRDLSRHEFAGHLSALKGAGVYRQTSDPAFGEVKL
jgi:hypothetical protein